jgi:hypothetical protein
MGARAVGRDHNAARALFLSNTAEERVEALDAGVPFHRPFGNLQDDGSGSNRENISSTPLQYFRGAPRFDATGAILTRLFGGFAPDFPHYISGKEFKNENLYRL